jgi:hypothetical protein
LQLVKKRKEKISVVFFQFLTTKTLDPEPDQYLGPDQYPDPDSLEMLDPYPDQDSVNSNTQHWL